MVDSQWAGSDIIQNGKLCPIEYFDIILVKRNTSAHIINAISEYDTNPKADKVLLLFVIADFDLHKLMNVAAEGNQTFTKSQKEKSFLYLRRWLHDQLIEEDKNGDSALSCVFFNITQFEGKLKQMAIISLSDILVGVTKTEKCM